jgi:hypothetical protein
MTTPDPHDPACGCDDCLLAEKVCTCKPWQPLHHQDCAFWPEPDRSAVCPDCERPCDAVAAHEELDRLTALVARLTPAPGSSLVVSVGVDGTTSTHQLEQVGWADDARDLTSKPGQFYGWALTDERKVTGFDEPVYRLVAVPVRDPQEPHDG